MMMSLPGKGGLPSSRNSVISASTKELRLPDGRKSTMAMTKDEDKIKPGLSKPASSTKRPGSKIDKWKKVIY